MVLIVWIVFAIAWFGRRLRSFAPGRETIDTPIGDTHAFCRFWLSLPAIVNVLKEIPASGDESESRCSSEVGRPT